MSTAIAHTCSCVLPTEDAPVSSLCSGVVYSFLVACLSGPLTINFGPWFLQGETKKTWLSQHQGVGMTCI